MHRDYGSQGPCDEGEVPYEGPRAGFPIQKNQYMGADAAQRERYVPAAIGQQAMIVSNLEKLVDELTKRLDVVMASENEITGTGAAEGNQAKDNRPPLAISITQNTQRISSTNTKLERILRRLEV